jgi:hypothetical protein
VGNIRRDWNDNTRDCGMLGDEGRKLCGMPVANSSYPSGRKLRESGQRDGSGLRVDCQLKVLGIHLFEQVETRNLQGPTGNGRQRAGGVRSLCHRRSNEVKMYQPGRVTLRPTSSHRGFPRLGKSRRRSKYRLKRRRRYVVFVQIRFSIAAVVVT